MKKFITTFLVFCSVMFSLYAQGDTIFLNDNTGKIGNDTISINQLSKHGVKVISVTENAAQKSDIIRLDSGVNNKESNQPQNLDASLEINNVVLTDLAKAHRMDSLWFKNLYQPVLYDSIIDVKNTIDKEVSMVLDTVQIKRQLDLLNQKTQMSIVYHPALVRTIKVFLKNRKKSLGRLFGMAQYYFPIFEEKLAKYDIPLEMKYLAIVESALNPRAVSRAGAGGLWQFMYSTGKMYDLEINTYVDERFNPIQESEAACKHMQDLYRIFKDWNLVLAAYNSGAGNVTKAIRRSGGYTNYWNIRPYLPRETAGYVPLFQATLFLGEYAEDYGIVTKKKDFHYIATDTIQVKHSISLDQVSRLLKIDLDELEFLNPQYKLNIIPYVEGQHYTLKLPLELVGVFVNNEALIYELVQKEFNRKEKPLPKFYKLNNYITYRVRSGDYLGRIARKFHVGVSKIKRWNHLRSNRLKISQKLKIYSRYAVATSGKRSHKKKHKTKKNKIPHGKYITYQVKEGDTLWNITRKYNISIEQIVSWNRIKANSKLKPGMKLKIYKVKS